VVGGGFVAPLATSGLGATGLQRRLAAAWAGAGRGGEGGWLLIGSQGCAPPVAAPPLYAVGGVVRHAGAKMTTTLAAVAAAAVPTNEEPDADVQTEGSNLTPPRAPADHHRPTDRPPHPTTTISAAHL